MCEYLADCRGRDYRWGHWRVPAGAIPDEHGIYVLLEHLAANHGRYIWRTVSGCEFVGATGGAAWLVGVGALPHRRGSGLHRHAVTDHPSTSGSVRARLQVVLLASGYIVAPLAGIIFYLQHERARANRQVVSALMLPVTWVVAITIGAITALAALICYIFPTLVHGDLALDYFAGDPQPSDTAFRWARP